MPRFGDPGLLALLDALDDARLDALDFGVIGFDADSLVRRYNAHESRSAQLAPETVLGRHLFADVAICMNNYPVAQRFEDAAAAGGPLDDTIDYVLTWRMRLTKVKLRLMHDPRVPMRYVALERLS
ncbi:MAG: phosphonate transporter [Comamonadaceae bacterium]|nr:phosphonate transporter [Comamonadaceae bacterium]